MLFVQAEALTRNFHLFISFFLNIFFFSLLLVFHIVEGWLHRVCQSLAKVPFVPEPPWRSRITSDGWEGGGKRASKGKSWDSCCLSPGKKDFACWEVAAHSTYGMFLDFQDGNQKSALTRAPGIFQQEGEGVINRKILNSLQIFYSSEVPVTDPVWDFVHEVVVWWWEEKSEWFKYGSRCEKRFKKMVMNQFAKAFLNLLGWFLMINGLIQVGRGT